MCTKDLAKTRVWQNGKKPLRSIQCLCVSVSVCMGLCVWGFVYMHVCARVRICSQKRNIINGAFKPQNIRQHYMINECVWNNMYWYKRTVALPTKESTTSLLDFCGVKWRFTFCFLCIKFAFFHSWTVLAYCSVENKWRYFSSLEYDYSFSFFTEEATRVAFFLGKYRTARGERSSLQNPNFYCIFYHSHLTNCF